MFVERIVIAEGSAACAEKLSTERSGNQKNERGVSWVSGKLKLEKVTEKENNNS